MIHTAIHTGHFHCFFFFLLRFYRWLDRNEDDGQIVRELVPAGDGLRLFSEDPQLKITI